MVLDLSIPVKWTGSPRDAPLVGEVGKSRRALVWFWDGQGEKDQASGVSGSKNHVDGPVGENAITGTFSEHEMEFGRYSVSAEGHYRNTGGGRWGRRFEAFLGTEERISGAKTGSKSRLREKMAGKQNL